jgi:hypothetical protein
MIIVKIRAMIVSFDAQIGARCLLSCTVAQYQGQVPVIYYIEPARVVIIYYLPTTSVAHTKVARIIFRILQH